MKLLQSLKEYNRFVLKENARLKSIYARLINESGDNKDIEEDDILKNRNHNAHVSVDEAELSQDDFDEIASITGGDYKGGNHNPVELGKQADQQYAKIRKNSPEDYTVRENEPEISEEEFFGEAEKAKAKTTEEAPVEEEELMTAEEFFGKISECDNMQKESGDKTVNTITAEEFFGECDAEDIKETEKKPEIEEDELMTAEEFFGEAEKAKTETTEAAPVEKPVEEAEKKDDEVPAEKPVEEAEKKDDVEKPVEEAEKKDDEVPAEKPVKEAEKKDDEVPAEKPVEEAEKKDDEVPAEKPVEEAEKKDEDKELAESLQLYKKMNYRLFN